MWPRWRGWRGWRGSRNTVSLWVFQFSSVPSVRERTTATKRRRRRKDGEEQTDGGRSCRREFRKEKAAASTSASRFQTQEAETRCSRFVLWRFNAEMHQNKPPGWF